MSSPLVDLVFDVPDISIGQFSVLIALCRFASNKDYTCILSLTRVAKAAHMSVRRVQRTLPSLIELKLVAVLAKGNGRGNGHTYQINARLLRSITRTSVSRKYLYQGGETMDETLNYDTVSSIRQPRSRTLRRQNDDLTLPEANVTPLENSEKPATHTGGFDKDQVRGSKSVRATMSAAESAKREAAYLTAVVHDDYESLAVLVALNHPRSKMRKLTRSKVAAGDVEAILEAMETEAKEQGSTMAEVGRDMLADLDRWNEVPRERWQDASPLKSFFKKREYRFDPRDIPGAVVDSELTGGADGGVRHEDERRDGSALLGGEAVPGPGASRPTLFPYPRRDVQPVLSRPRRPLQVQWPRRIR